MAPPTGAMPASTSSSRTSGLTATSASELRGLGMSDAPGHVHGRRAFILRVGLTGGIASGKSTVARMLVELRKVIPAFLRRVDLPERGVEWSRYLAERREETAALRI